MFFFRRFFNSINHQAQTIASAAIIIGALSLVSRILGVFRDRILAGEFGAGDTLDVYYAAFRLPDLVFNILILGAISAGLIPIFTNLIGDRENAKAWRLLNNTLNFLFTGLLIVCVILFFLFPYILPIITPGFSGEKMALTVKMSQIMLLAPVFLGLSAIFGSALQSYKRFFAYSLAPIFYNVGIIIGALFLTKYWGIYGLAWGVVLGAGLHFLTQLPPVLALGYRYGWHWEIRDKNVIKVGKMMIPRTLTLIINQFNVLIATVMASTLAVGSLAIYNLADNLQNFPLGLFAISFAVAALPTLSALGAKEKLNDFVQILSSTCRQIFFFLFPLAILFYVLRAQMVRIILGSGHFGWTDTRLTAACLALFVLSLFAQGGVLLLIRAFYALHDSRTPFFIGLVSLAVNFGAMIFFKFIFSFSNGFSFFAVSVLKIADLWSVADLRILALPLAVGLAAIFNFFWLLIFLRRRIGWLDGRKILNSTWRIVFSSLAAGLFAYAFLQLVNQWVETATFAGILLQGLVAGLIGLFGYWLFSLILKVEEMKVFIAAFKRKFLRLNNVVIEDNTGEGEGT